MLSGMAQQCMPLALGLFGIFNLGHYDGHGITLCSHRVSPFRLLFFLLGVFRCCARKSEGGQRVWT